MQTVSFAQLPYVLQQSPLVVVDFTSPSCGPCRNMPPLLEQLHNMTGVRVFQVNIDESPKLTQSYGITTVPTIVVFQRGQEVNRGIGVPTSAQRLVNMVQPYM